MTQQKSNYDALLLGDHFKTMNTNSKNDLVLLHSDFCRDPFWTKPIVTALSKPLDEMVDLFDQNGYDLCELEKLFYEANGHPWSNHREHRCALKRPWFVQEPKKNSGAVLNHALLFERKGYSEKALKQLQQWAKQCPLVYKLANIKPKWGIDFSIDYAGADGKTFEIFHYEYDSFDLEEAIRTKKHLEQVIENTDWEQKARELIARKDEWYGLDFHNQSDWKCRFFGLGPERFKMVLWKWD